MVILLNGAFGIGKTTVARAIRQVTPKAMLFDPERIGFVLQRLPRWIPVERGSTRDFQDMPLWRTLTVRGVRAARLVRPIVIVPMTFTNLDYLSEVRKGIRVFEPDVRHVCLIAPYGVVKERLLKRNSDPTVHAWQYRRNAECCEVHRRAEFGEHIPTASRGINEIVDDILSRMSSTAKTRRSQTVNGRGHR